MIFPKGSMVPELYSDVVLNSVPIEQSHVQYPGYPSRKMLYISSCLFLG